MTGLMTGNVLRYIKNILVPPRKGDIRLRCAIAVRYSEDNELNRSLLDNIDNGEDEDEEDDELTCINDEKNNFFSLNSIQNTFLNWFHTEKKEIKHIEEIEDNEYYVTSPLDTFIGYTVEVAGSVYVFLITMLLLIGWIIWGCITGATDTWQIVMQDGQSIQTYVWNTFLMRQQLDNDEKILLLYGKLKSRSITHKRLLQKIIENNENIDFESFIQREKENDFKEKSLVTFKSKNLYDKVSELVSKCLGNLTAVSIYWIGIFVWIGCGALPINEGTKENPDWETFSNTWQMYVNTATAIELLFTSVFLENVRSRSNEFTIKQTNIFNQLDSDLEYLLRDINDNDDIENDLVIVKRCKRDKIQKGISLYAHVIGNGLGLIISICVFTIWLSIGNLMHWNANWWLVIGSYTGLTGFIDGFVLREVFFSITNYEQNKFIDLLTDSQELLDIIGIPVDLKRNKLNKSFSTKISIFINKICSSKWSVLTSFITVLGLVIFASALKWSETAQLIVNTPAMIIEAFFFLILIQAHNWAEEERTFILSELVKSRVLIYNYIKKHHVS